ncbi:multiple inositol polyphosphate phosphatase 1 isoform X4 [Drosophila grimshawi]|uniref:multiple inositol polyphosphate phosphatase 1 isoform X4 n=1 Tax=Drosophila grimshawi TaxID=7222 RepID=UPI000C86FE78|nr:multiple inositol polyphosphate phosphatase 1 isoform X4 [Drosophila grimshawi]
MLNSYVLIIPLLLILLLLLLQHHLTTADAVAACNNVDRSDIERRLSTKTPYRAIANYNDSSPKYDGCHPTRVWAIIRHGTRNPSESVILHAKRRLTEIKALLLKQSEPNFCADELNQLRHWNWDHIDANDEKLLVAEGEDELIELAERMQSRFPNLLPDIYNPEWFYMKYTATQRTLKSAQSFATGLFGRHRIHAITYPEPLHRDPVLRSGSPMHTKSTVATNERIGIMEEIDEQAHKHTQHTHTHTHIVKKRNTKCRKCVFRT